MTSEKGCRKDKNQNIQVFVRLRPLNQRERDIKSLGVIEVLHNREVVVRQSHTKKFTFDRAFGPNAKQVEVYQEVVSPLIEEVLAGYNCTVFAYGQTGTGKTHTMVGESTSEDFNWQNDPLAGIIPRALSQLFDELRISATEHTVRVSYLELYNEELFDLLSSSEDNSKLRIYEDVTRKGSNIVNGLEEITVSNKNEVYRIMSQGQERKRVASTLMNAQSSRSHTVFTIVVHMKENSPEGEELVKIGKLNLVDLAGSENISKAGSDNPAKKERARECVNINQSLLTLGRVITALVEKHPHIPYRESKLTRILQESLGGRTKTSIIATISPGHKDLEETMSTLEYANRAKNIQNKPEVNQKMTKKAILRQYAEEIDRLKKDLQAARDKNGVFLSNDTYLELTLKQEEHRKEIQELLLQKRATEEEKDKMEGIFTDLHNTLEMRVLELNSTKNKLSNTKTQLTNTNNMLRSTQMQSEERAHLVEKHQVTESTLSLQAQELLAVADVATNHVRCLHETVDKRRNVECSNLQVTRTYREQSADQRAHITSYATHFAHSLVENLNGLHSALENFTSTSTDTLQNNKTTLDQLAQNIAQMMNEIKSIMSDSQKCLVSATDSHRALVKASIDRRQASVEAALATLLQGVASSVQAAQTHNLPESVANFVDQWYTSVRERIESLRRTHAQFNTKLSESEAARAQALRSHRAARRAHIDKCVKDINETIAEIEEEKLEIQARLKQQQADMETERRDTEARLNLWVQEERRLFEERLQAHVHSETAAMELRLATKAQEIESERSRLEARITRHVESHQSLLSACTLELEHVTREQAENDAGGKRTENAVTSYSKELDDGAAAISLETEALSKNVVEVARQVYTDLLDTLLRANEQIQNDTKAVAIQDSEASDQFLKQVDAARTDLLQDNQNAMDFVFTHIEASNTSTISTLTSLSTATETLLSGARHHATSHATAVQDVKSVTASFEDQLREAVERHAELEGRYLSEEYKVYSPTGATPQRSEYRYPRSLAATSPHQRILARFRAMQQNSREDDECIVVDSDTESRHTSDGESSISEDSAVFAAPSPPAHAPPTLKPPREVNRNVISIMKSISESDIYNIQRNQEHQGKENADSSMTNGNYKKPSKLRAPSTHKKPLIQRN